MTTATPLLNESNYEIQQLKEKATYLNESEFDDFLVNYINDNKKNGKSFGTTQNELALAGVTLYDASPITLTSSTESLAGEVTPNYISPSYIVPDSYIAKRAGEIFYRVYGQVTFKAKEISPASLDLLSVEWDPTKATYDYYNVGGRATLARANDVSKGILFFNVEDKSMNAGDIAYGVAYIVPKASATRIDIRMHLSHTYNTATHSWTFGINGNVALKDGPSGGATFEVTGNNALDSYLKRTKHLIKF